MFLSLLNSEIIFAREYNKSSEYQNINFDNYHMYFDDLLGFRLIMLYTEDWYGIHNAIINQFPCDETRFLGKSDRSESDISQPFVIAKPEINIRNGDIESIYSSRFSDPLTNHFVLKKGRYYRSIHYSVYSGHYCFEIQVRSVYDEAWSEVDHDVLYPQYLGNKRLIQFSGMLNRLAGLSNEMSSFFKTEIVESLTKNYTPVSTLDRVPNEIELQKTGSTKPQTMSAGKGNSVGDIINNLIRGDKI